MRDFDEMDGCRKGGDSCEPLLEKVGNDGCAFRHNQGFIVHTCHSRVQASMCPFLAARWRAVLPDGSFPLIKVASVLRMKSNDWVSPRSAALSKGSEHIPFPLVLTIIGVILLPRDCSDNDERSETSQSTRGFLLIYRLITRIPTARL